MPELIGKLGYDGRGFSAGMNQALGEAKAASEKMSGYFSQAFSGGGGPLAGAAGALGITSGVNKLIALADALTDKFKEAKIAAGQMGVEIEMAERISNITKATGTGPETAAIAMQHIADNLEKIRNGEAGFEKLIQQFAQLGISVKDIQEGTRQGIFLKIFAGFEGQPKVSDAQMSAAKGIMGRGGDSLIPAAQLGVDSVTGHAGNLSPDQNDSMKHMLAIDRTFANREKELDTQVGYYSKKVLTWIKVFSGHLSLFDAEGQLKKEEQLAKSISEKRTAIRKKEQESLDKEASELIDKTLATNRKAEDDKIIAVQEKENTQLDKEIEKESRAVRLAKMSPQERKVEFQREKTDEGTYALQWRRIAEESTIQGDEKHASLYRQFEKQHQLKALQADASLQALENKPIRSSEQTFDSLARIGGFSQNAGNADTTQAELLAAAKETAKNTKDIATGDLTQ